MSELFNYGFEEDSWVDLALFAGMVGGTFLAEKAASKLLRNSSVSKRIGIGILGAVSGYAALDSTFESLGVYDTPEEKQRRQWVRERSRMPRRGIPEEDLITHAETLQRLEELLGKQAERPLNTIAEINKETLVAITPDKQLWKLEIPTLSGHEDFQGMEGLEVIGALQQATSEQLGEYGIRQANPGIRTL